MGCWAAAVESDVNFRPRTRTSLPLQDDAFVRFFILREGAIFRDPLYNNHFVLKVVDDADVDAAIAALDKEMGDIQPGV